MKQVYFFTISIIFSLFCSPAVSRAQAVGGERYLVPVGGGQFKNELLAKFLSLSKQTDPHVLIIPQAAHPDGIERSAQRFVTAFREIGVKDPQVLDLSNPKQALEAIGKSDVIWMPGGGQGRLRRALEKAGVADAIRKKYESGAIVGGTSAGASIQSDVMMLQSKRDKETGILTPTLSYGLKLWPEVIIDQHFSQRKRLERLEIAVKQHPDLLGIGLDECTGVIYDGKNSFTVVGEGTVTVLHAIDPKAADPQLKKEILVEGDRYDVKNRTSTRQFVTQIHDGKGIFEFSGYKPMPDKKMRVFYYKPEGDVSQMPILFVMHGVLRNADTYRDNWVALADQYKVLVIVPEFSKADFPGSRSYNYGNVRTKDGEKVTEEYWSYSLLDPIFESVVKQTGSQQDGYDLFGHSAGSQFVHRFLLLKGNTKAKRIVASNAGSYMMPTLDVAFPFGLKDTQIDKEHLKKILSKDVIIQLGEADTSRTEKYLPKGKAAMRQGAYRLERGKNFFKTAQELAQKEGAVFNWRLHTVPGVGHDNGAMAVDAAKLLYGP